MKCVKSVFYADDLLGILGQNILELKTFKLFTFVDFN